MTITKMRATVITAIIAVFALVWITSVPPNHRRGVNEDYPRTVTVIAYASNDSLTIDVTVSTNLRGNIHTLNGYVTGNDSWTEDYELAAHERIRVDVNAYVYVSHLGDYGTVRVRIEDNGTKVRDSDVQKVRRNRVDAIASARYVT